MGRVETCWPPPTPAPAPAPAAPSLAPLMRTHGRPFRHITLRSRVHFSTPPFANRVIFKAHPVLTLAACRLPTAGVQGEWRRRE